MSTIQSGLNHKLDDAYDQIRILRDQLSASEEQTSAAKLKASDLEDTVETLQAKLEKKVDDATYQDLIRENGKLNERIAVMEKYQNELWTENTSLYT
jgi:chromosome segregation ATPase